MFIMAVFREFRIFHSNFFLTQQKLFHANGIFKLFIKINGSYNQEFRRRDLFGNTFMKLNAIKFKQKLLSFLQNENGKDQVMMMKSLKKFRSDVAILLTKSEYLKYFVLILSLHDNGIFGIN